ncbi:MAG: regulatory protein RecX [Desulfuromusa sp.]|jgi:regulatory protein|nr:regulatory protein RecX [Desulfuromusa sp.]
MDKSKSNASKSFAAALRLLTRRDRSETELRQKLGQFDFSLSAIESAVEKCREYNYLDDNRYATERARTLMRTGRGVGSRIMLDLRQRGIDETIARQALEIVNCEFDTSQLLRDQLQKRFPDFDYQHAEKKQCRRLISYFQRRGYTLGEIFQTIQQK